MKTNRFPESSDNLNRRGIECNRCSVNKSELSLLNNWKNRLTTVRWGIFSRAFESFRFRRQRKGGEGSLSSLVTIVAHYPSQYCAHPCIADGSIEPENFRFGTHLRMSSSNLILFVRSSSLVSLELLGTRIGINGWGKLAYLWNNYFWPEGMKFSGIVGNQSIKTLRENWTFTQINFEIFTYTKLSHPPEFWLSMILGPGLRHD